MAHTICVCTKMLNHGLNHRLFLSLFKLIPCHIHWIVYVLGYWISYLNFKAVLELPKMARTDQTNKSISFIWIVWSTLFMYISTFSNPHLKKRIHRYCKLSYLQVSMWIYCSNGYKFRSAKTWSLVLLAQ